MKTTNGITTKYVYGLGLIGEETNNTFVTYHFDYRGSTVAITDSQGNITDTFEYDTYGRLSGRTGVSDVIFLYNGRDGVVTDKNELLYMRSRYYSPELRRFVNADIIAGDVSNTIPLNRYAYANGNPVSFIDPFGLSSERGSSSVLDKLSATYEKVKSFISKNYEAIKNEGGLINWIKNKFYSLTAENKLDAIIDLCINAVPDENDIYHIGQDYWQSWKWIGYNDLYDLVFDTATSMNRAKFNFSYGDTEYIIWAWKGDYTNLGAGAELGIYKKGIGDIHWFTCPEKAMQMTLSLYSKTENTNLYNYTPTEKTWWITGFDPSHQNVDQSDLQAAYTINFSTLDADVRDRRGFYNAFKESVEEDNRWTFDGWTATFTWV